MNKHKIALLLSCCLLFTACGANKQQPTNDSAMQNQAGNAAGSLQEEVFEETESPVVDPAAHLPYRQTVAAGDDTSIAIMQDGSIVTAAYEAAGYIDPDATYVSVDSYNHYILLKADGTATAGMFEGNESAFSKATDVRDWTDLVAVTAGMFCSAGLRSDGTVVITDGVTKDHDQVAEWTDIVMIDAGYFLVGLKSDGTVVAATSTKSRSFESWTDIVAISTSSSYIMGLKSDGTVVAWSTNANNPMLDVSGWTDIVQISAGLNHAVGLKADGTVVSTQIVDKEYDRGETQVEGWTDIVAISANYTHTLGIKSDGTVVSAGTEDACDVSGWGKAQLP